MLKNLCVSVCLLCLVPSLRAQERVPSEEAQRIAQKLTEYSDKLEGLTIKVEPDTEKPVGLKEGEHGGMVIPDKKLTAALLAAAGKEIVPVGYLWLKKVTLAKAGAAVPNDQVRLVSITANGEELSIPHFQLGARKGTTGLELVVIAKGDKPLTVVPLTAVEGGAQELPIEMAAQKTGDATADLTLTLVGKYKATLAVTALPE